MKELGKERDVSTAASVSGIGTRYAVKDLRALLASKHHCSPELHKVGTQVVDALDRALAQAATNLATIRPSGDGSLGDDAIAWREALLDGKASPW